jgi:hypothetical protein
MGVQVSKKNMKKNGCPGFIYDEGRVKANKMNDVFIGYWLE